MSNLVSRRSALASGAAALLGLLVARTRAVFGSAAAVYLAESGERGDVASFGYDNFARPESELIDESGCRRVKCIYDNKSSKTVVIDTMVRDSECYAYDDEGIRR